MTSENANAYPLDLETINRAENGRYSFTGLTKLEYFAGLAMQGIVTAHYDTCAQTPEDTSLDAVRIAKALIEQLNKENNE